MTFELLSELTFIDKNQSVKHANIIVHAVLRFLTWGAHKFFDMKKVLLVGASGQLGSKVFEKLAKSNKHSIRIFVREDSKIEHLKPSKPEIFIGDLKDKKSIEKVVEGCDFIITTANSAAPRKKEDTFKAVDIQGFKDLIDAAGKNSVQQFIFTSAFFPAPEKYARWIPLAESKVKTETYLKKSGVPYTIFQPPSFMDIYFAFLGTAIPLRNEPAHLINRPWGFMQNFFKGVKDNVANGRIGIIGDGQAKHSYITVDNVADFIVKSLDEPELFNQTHPIGGPEALSALEVKAVFEKVLGKELKVKRTPAFMMKFMGNVFSLFNTSASNILKLNYLGAVESSEIDCKELAGKLSIDLTSAEDYLKLKTKG